MSPAKFQSPLAIRMQDGGQSLHTDDSYFDPDDINHSPQFVITGKEMIQSRDSVHLQPGQSLFTPVSQQQSTDPSSLIQQYFLYEKMDPYSKRKIQNFQTLKYPLLSQEGLEMGALRANSQNINVYQRQYPKAPPEPIPHFDYTKVTDSGRHGGEAVDMMNQTDFNNCQDDADIVLLTTDMQLNQEI